MTSKITKQDPTGQASNRLRAEMSLDSRLKRSERLIKSLFREIPRQRKTQVKIVNAEQTVFYEYDISAFELAQFNSQIDFILNEELLETQGDTMPSDWYWKEDIERPYRQGTVEVVRDFNQLVAGAVAAGVLVSGFPPRTISIEEALLSPQYQQALNNLQVSNFSTIKGLSERTSSQVIQRINAGIQAGATPTDITRDITDRFNVAFSSAKRISDTEINRAYNNAQLDATRVLGEQTGLREGVIHISALLPTTRETHAARHGNAYTVEDQLQWWDTGSNRINCKCSIIPVLIDNNGKVVQAQLQEELKEERAFFDS